jgi:hypothetical protein
LSGHLLDSLGRPAPGYYVVVYSTDRAMWGQSPRRKPAPVRTTADGSFKFTGLPAGKYYVATLTEVDQTDLTDSTFLQSLIPSAIQVTLADGEKKTQELRLR